MQLINLTPHAVDIMSTSGSVVSIPASGMVARLTTSTEVVKEEDGIRFTRTIFGEPTALPEEKAEFFMRDTILNAVTDFMTLLSCKIFAIVSH